MYMTLLTEGKSSVFYRPKFGDTLSVSGKNFVVRSKEGEVRKKIPVISARDVLIFGEADISSRVFKLARDGEIPIHFLDGRGRLSGSVRYDFSRNVFLRHRQIAAHNDSIERLSLARSFVETKVRNQNVFLRKLRAPYRLGEIGAAENLETLRGLEGASAREYFSFWKNGSVIKNKAFFFPGRVKRPPHDKVNALLGMCYTMLHSEALTQCMIAGLDPYVGFLHDQRYGHAALASDFTEIFRGVADHFVVKAINLKEFDADDFEKKEGGEVHLSKAGFQKFFPMWTRFLRYETLSGEKKSIVAIMERDVRRLVHYFMGDEEKFNLFLWKI